MAGLFGIRRSNKEVITSVSPVRLDPNVAIELVTQRQPEIRAVRHTSVTNPLSAEWHTLPPIESAKNRTDVQFVIAEEIPYRGERHKGGRRVLLQGALSLSSKQGDHVAQLVQIATGISQLAQMGAFNESQLAQIQDAFTHPPENVQAHMDKVSRITDWQTKVRLERRPHSIADEWLRTAVNAVIRNIPFLKK